jgi:hypothetical protein
VNGRLLKGSNSPPRFCLEIFCHQTSLRLFLQATINSNKSFVYLYLNKTFNLQPRYSHNTTSPATTTEPNLRPDLEPTFKNTFTKYNIVN